MTTVMHQKLSGCTMTVHCNCRGAPPRCTRWKSVSCGTSSSGGAVPANLLLATSGYARTCAKTGQHTPESLAMRYPRHRLDTFARALGAAAVPLATAGLGWRVP